MSREGDNPRNLKFAPNNNEASKLLFTGRTKDLEKIFNFILSGNCVALYGERKSGKTLTLKIIQAIINGDIKSYENSLVDQTLYNALRKWQYQFFGYKAIYISLEGLRNEQELINEIVYEIQKVKPLQFSNNNDKDRLYSILDKIQTTFSSSNQKIIVLLDEMEILGKFVESEAIAELFCNQINYSRIIFVHTGSYLWKQKVSSPGSIFTHLAEYYLKSIDESDMKNFLLQPLSDKDKLKVAELSGGKPLYTQCIAKIVDESDTFPTENRLLQNVNISYQIEINIYQENNLDDNSKKVLAAISHNVESTEKELATKLKLNIIETKKILTNFVNFGTVSESKGKYKIVGKLIEKYGKEKCDDPCRKDYLKPPISHKDKISLILPWILMIVMIFLGTWSYSYTNPSTESKNMDFSHGSIILNIPRSVEIDERGIVIVSVTNTGTTPINSLKLLFYSSDIQYEKEEKNSITFSDIEPGDTINRAINYWVRSGNDNILETKVIISGTKKSIFFNSNLRKLQLKKYQPHLSQGLIIFGFIIVGKTWISVALTIFKQLNNTLEKL